MVSLIQNLFIPAYNIASGRDIHSGVSLKYCEARKEAKKLFRAIGAVSMAVGSFFALSAILQKIPAKYSLLGSCVLTAGCVALSHKRASPLVTKASAMTAVLFIVREGVVNLALLPVVQSVKAALHWVTEPRMSLGLVESCLSGVAGGYLRCMGGLISLGVGFWILDSAVKQRTKSGFPLDRGVSYLSKKCASGLVALFRYKKYTPPPAQDRSLRPIIK
jgi:hypothetical protein